MLTRLAWLGLEVKYLERARQFYAETLELSECASVDGPTDAPAVAFQTGDAALLLRRPESRPRGGVHTHFACSIPHAEYDEWWGSLSIDYDLQEHRFGEARSLYLYDPDGNCVELGQQDVTGPGIDGIFEIVLEVADLEAAEDRYATLGFETIDRGSSRRRVRMAGPVALELWEPQLGIADARGGLHVDLGFETADLEATAAALEPWVCSLERDGDRLVAIDPDGHHLTVLES